MENKGIHRGHSNDGFAGSRNVWHGQSVAKLKVDAAYKGKPLSEFAVTQSDSELASGFTQQETIESDLDRVSDTNFEIRDEVDRVQLPREEFDKVYQSAVSGVVNSPGKLPHSRKEYEDFLMTVCGMGAEKHKALKRRAALEKAELKLHLTVCRAEGLIAKDNTGTSDPYCQLALVRDQQVKKPQKDLYHWMKEKIINTVYKTDVVDKDLSPVWNNTFNMVVLDSNSEYLAVEIWDSDEVGSSIVKSKGVKGIINYIHDLNKGDDFLGKIYIPLKDVSFDGVEKWYNLVSHKGNPRGRIYLHLIIQSRLPSVSEETAMDWYSNFYRFLVTHHLAEKREDVWGGLLSVLGEELLQIYSARLGLKKLQQAACKLSVLFKERLACHLALLATVRDISESQVELEQETATKPFKPWVQKLLVSLKDIVNGVHDFIIVHQLKINLKTGEKMNTFRALLQTVKFIYKIDAYVITLDRSDSDLSTVMKIAIKASCAKWYTKLLSASLEIMEHDSAGRIVITVGALRGMINFLTRSKQKLAPYFNELGVDYFAEVYSEIDLQLAGDLETILSNSDSSQDSFMLYQMLKVFNELGRDIQGRDFKLKRFHQYFTNHLKFWIDDRIKLFDDGMWKAVKQAEAVPVVHSVKYSSAVRDTIDLLVRVCSFIKVLAWPEPEQATAILFLMTEQLCGKLLLFVDDISVKLDNHNFYIEERPRGRMVTEKLCVHLNDIQQLQRGLADLPEHLDWESQRKELRKTRESEAVLRTVDAMNTQLKSTADDMCNKMVQLYDDFAMQLRDSISSKLLQIANPKCPFEKALEDLMRYLTDLLTVLFQGLFQNVFIGVLSSLWDAVVRIFGELLSELTYKDKEVLHNVEKTVQNLLTFFNSEGSGLEEQHLKTLGFQKVEQVLSLRLKSTSQVISEYWEEMLAYQKEGSCKDYGRVATLTAYNLTSSELEATLVKVSGLPEEASNVWVSVSLLPDAGGRPFKTDTKKTADPIFDTTFKFLLPVEKLAEKGGAVLFEVFSHELLSSKCVGIALIPLSEVPKVDMSDALVSEQVHLNASPNVFLPIDSPALKELHERANARSHRASDFCKKIKKWRSQ